MKKNRQIHEKQMSQEQLREFPEHSQDSRKENAANKFHISQCNNASAMMENKVSEHLWNSRDQRWCDITEVVDSDFLISPGDIYPNRKVELEDAVIKQSTKDNFETLCVQQHEVFSKNNKDIG